MKMNVMKIIQTRQNRQGNWWCNVTIDGYDYSFESKTIADARQQMQTLLAQRGIAIDAVVFSEPKPYPKEEKYPKPQIGYAAWRIDKEAMG